MSHLFLKKNIAQLLANANGSADNDEHNSGNNSELKRTLGPFNITMLGVGAIIGAGIFSLTGEAAAKYSGPGIIYSFIIGGALCAMAGLCYAEMAAMIPVSGSAYAYSYVTMGEVMAWIIGWALVLEYAFGASVVANSWSGYLLSLLHKTLGINIPDAILYYTKGPWETVTLNSGQIAYGIWNLPATFIVIVVTAVLYRGISKSATFNTIIVIIKMTIVALFILLGFGVISWANLHANPNVSGLASLVPAPEIVINAAGNQISRYGWLNGGVLTGAGMVFFAYIGLDAVSTVAQEAKNPKRDMPIGILASLLICTMLYVLVGLTLTGVVSYKELGVSDPIALGIDQIVLLRHWPPFARTIFAFMIKLGALAGLTSVVLVFTMGQTRIFYSISNDGLLPWFNRLHPRLQTPHIATVFTGAFIAVCSGLLPIGMVANLVSLGTLMVFLMVCVNVAILRFTNPKAERPFTVPLAWLTCPGGVIACLWVMSGLDLATWVRLGVWLTVGIAIYFIYGRRHSTSQLSNGYTFGPAWIDCVGVCLLILGLVSTIWAGYALMPNRNSALCLPLGSGINTVIIVLIGVIAAGFGIKMISKNVNLKINN